MLQKHFAVFVAVLVLFTFNVLVKPLPLPQSPKSPGKYRLANAAQHMRNAGNAGKEALQGAGSLALHGAVGACNGSSCSHLVTRPAVGAAGGAGLGAIHAVRAGASAACAAGQLCGYIKDKANQIAKSPKERASQDQARGEKLAAFKAKSKETHTNLVQERQRVARKIGFVSTAQDREHYAKAGH